MIEMRPIRLRCGPGTSGGSADSAVVAECAMGELLRLQPLDRPATDIHYRFVSRKSATSSADGQVRSKRCATVAMAVWPAARRGMVKDRAEPAEGEFRVGRGSAIEIYVNTMRTSSTGLLACPGGWPRTPRPPPRTGRLPPRDGGTHRQARRAPVLAHLTAPRAIPSWTALPAGWHQGVQWFASRRRAARRLLLVPVAARHPASCRSGSS